MAGGSAGPRQWRQEPPCPPGGSWASAGLPAAGLAHLGLRPESGAGARGRGAPRAPAPQPPPLWACCAPVLRSCTPAAVRPPRPGWQLPPPSPLLPCNGDAFRLGKARPREAARSQAWGYQRRSAHPRWPGEGRTPPPGWGTTWGPQMALTLPWMGAALARAAPLLLGTTTLNCRVTQAPCAHPDPQGPAVSGCN